MARTIAADAVSGPEQITILLLVQQAGAAATLRDALASHDGTCVEVCTLASGTDDVAAIVGGARAALAGDALAVVVEDEQSAVAAIVAGADEVCLCAHLNDTKCFLERARLRAQTRRQNERLRAAQIHQEKLTALGTMVASVAHEINNPLTALQLSVEACQIGLKPMYEFIDTMRELTRQRQQLDPEVVYGLVARLRRAAPHAEARELLSELLDSARAIADVVQDLRVFARADGEQEVELVDPNEVVNQALRLVRHEVSNVAVIERDFERYPARLRLPAGRVVQVLVNVFINAAHAMNTLERPLHRVRVRTRSDAECCLISITDTGPGIAAELMEQVFEPFFSTKGRGMGTGLGLSISRAIMRELGGDLRVSSTIGQGATFTLEIPRQESMDDAPPTTRSSMLIGDSGVIARRTVLLVDEDEAILKAFSRVVGRFCNLVLARDANEAIEQLSRGTHVDVLVCESAAGNAFPQPLYEWVQRQRPELISKTLLLASAPVSEPHRSTLESQGIAFLSKPSTGAQLIDAITDLMQEGSAVGRAS